ncbi:hypothetical protein AAHA92_14087 [Salvia divinorum]|uniref:Uncharacterized protein n=1 Tax=Salvia divinorum TaxID=28513 RepID=A0ABD1HDR5_SALDI
MVKRKSAQDATPTAMTDGSSGLLGGVSVTGSPTSSKKKCFLERWLTNDFPSDNKEGSTGGRPLVATWLTPDFSCDDDEGFLRSQLTSPLMKSVSPTKPRWVATVKKEGCGDSVTGGTAGSEKCWLERWMTNDFPSDEEECSEPLPACLGNWQSDDFSFNEEEGFFRSQLYYPLMPPNYTDQYRRMVLPDN